MIKYVNPLTISELNFIEENGDKLYNLCPHNLTTKELEVVKVFPRTEDIAPVRVLEQYKEGAKICGVSTESKIKGDLLVTGLPEQETPGIYFIVSSVVREKLSHRKDLLSPTNNVEHIEKNEKGWTISVSHFETNL